MQQLNEKMNKAVESTHRNLQSIRTGRANPEILNRLQVEYYGQMVPVKQVASVSVPEAMTLMLNIFDKSAVKAVEKAILTSDLGINPQVDGSSVILRIPPLTEERRKELIKIAKKNAEDGKIAIRNIRRDYMDMVKKDKDLSEDENKKLQDDAQKATNKFTAMIDDLLKEKEAEIMKV